MKKIVMVLVVVMMAFGGIAAVSAQDAFGTHLPGTAKDGDNSGFAIGLNPYWTLSALFTGGFGIGGGVEFAFSKVLSGKVDAGFMTYNFLGVNVTVIPIYAGVRGYFFKTALNGPFAGALAGVMLTSASYGGVGLTIPVPALLLEGGYKFNLMGGHGFFVEPAVGYNLAFGGTGSVGGFYYTVNLGWAF